VAKFTLPNGTIIETDTPEEAEVVLRGIAPPPPPPPATPRPATTSGEVAAKRAAASARLAREPAPAEDEDETPPPPPVVDDWTPQAAGQFLSELPETGRAVLRILAPAGRKWTDGVVISQQAGFLPKGLGSVISSMIRIANEDGMPNPLERESERVGKTRVTRFRLSPEFLEAVAAVAGGRTPTP